MKMKSLLAAGASVALLGLAGTAYADQPQGAFPGYGLDTSPYILITLGSGGSVAITTTSSSPTYDGSDDTYIGVINNSGSTVYSLNLSANDDIFGFDGDGIDAYGAPTNATDTGTYGSGAYGGPDAYFTGISTFPYPETGTVNFLGGIKSGDQDYFSLEEALTAATFGGGGGGGGGITVTGGGVPEPSTWAMLMVGLGAVGAALRMSRRRDVVAAKA